MVQNVPIYASLMRTCICLHKKHHHHHHHHCFDIFILSSLLQHYEIFRSLYGYEIWSLILKEECRLKVLENRVLRRILGTNFEKIPGDWKRTECLDASN
jgi:hypothetical protein